MRRWHGLGLALAALTALTAAPLSAAAAEPNVVVTIKPIHSLVAQVMEGVSTPNLLVQGAQSPHTFALKPSDGRALSKADIFFRVSEAVEPFTRKAVAALPQDVRVVTLIDTPGLTLLPVRTGGAFEEHSHAEGEHDHHEHEHAEAGESAQAVDSVDGHIWLDPDNAQHLVQRIAETLSQRYPGQAARFAANAASVTARLKALTADMTNALEPVKDRPFIVFHDATQYLEKRFGLRAAGAITLSPDVQPSGRRLADVRRKISAVGAVCVFTEPGFQPKLVAAVTEGTAARAASLDVEGLAVEPGMASYFELMAKLKDALSGCLGAK